MYESDVDVIKELDELGRSDTDADHKKFIRKVTNYEDFQCDNCHQWFNEKQTHRCRPTMTIEQVGEELEQNEVVADVERQIEIFVNGVLAATVSESYSEAWKASYKKAIPRAKITTKLAAISC
ncbi:MAG: hypothetical protein JRN68_03275 [Nitrososphaerota archaeon]|nr:hypothetical protein [Ferrimicrobium acidiphilum]MDG6933699.1 hypothetical protein [Nitrososphaerota archaeon]